jgi:hypothetical protein
MRGGQHSVRNARPGRAGRRPSRVRHPRACPGPRPRRLRSCPPPVFPGPLAGGGTGDSPRGERCRRSAPRWRASGGEHRRLRAHPRTGGRPAPRLSLLPLGGPEAAGDAPGAGAPPDSRRGSRCWRPCRERRASRRPGRRRPPEVPALAAAPPPAACRPASGVPPSGVRRCAGCRPLPRRLTLHQLLTVYRIRGGSAARFLSGAGCPPGVPFRRGRQARHGGTASTPPSRTGVAPVRAAACTACALPAPSPPRVTQVTFRGGWRGRGPRVTIYPRLPCPKVAVRQWCACRSRRFACHGPGSVRGRRRLSPSSGRPCAPCVRAAAAFPSSGPARDGPVCPCGHGGGVPARCFVPRPDSG